MELSTEGEGEGPPLIARKGGANLLKKNLTNEEYISIPVPVRIKVEEALGEHVEDYLTAKALFQSTQDRNESKIDELKNALETTIQERDVLKLQVDTLNQQYEETKNRLLSNSDELNHLKETVKRLEKEAERTLREKEEAVDERQMSVMLAERRGNEIERLTGDIAVLEKQLKEAVAARCQAAVDADDIAAARIELQLKEKRLENERAVLTQQNVDLRIDLDRMAEKITQMRREATVEMLALRDTLVLKEEELKVLQEQKTNLSQANETLTKRIEKLTDDLNLQMEAENQTVDKFQQEIRSKEKMVQVHKDMLEVSDGKLNELTGMVRELQRLLQEGTAQYGTLETKLAQAEADQKAHKQHHEAVVAALKDELKAANELLNKTRNESSEEAISRLSPLAASSSKLLKSGLTLTQLYSQYAQVSEELLIQKQENARLTEYVERVVQEIEERAPALKKQREDYELAVNMVETLTVRMDEAESERSTLRKAARDAECNVAYLSRENARHSACVADLSRQVCYLLKELEASRGNFIPVHDSPKSNADIRTSSDVIEKHLVTFRDIEEMQKNNQKLIAALRELSDEKDAEENKRESKEVLELKTQVKELSYKISNLEEREDFLQKQIEMVKKQRDLYHHLLGVENKEVPDEEIDKSIEKSNTVVATPAKSIPTPPITPGAVVDSDSERIAMDELRKTFDSYRAERVANEKMLSETITRLQDENSKIASDRAKLSAQAEYATEKCKTLASANATLRAEVSALDKKCAAYIAANSRLEDSNKGLRQEALNATTKLSVLEVTASNLKEENQLLRDSEMRLQSERDMDRKMRVGQEILMANLEALKAKLECTDAESRARLEARLDHANTELAGLRRRLQEEQDRLRGEASLAEEQAKTAKERLQAERKAREAAMAELEEARRSADEANSAANDASTRVAAAIASSRPVVQRDNRIKELENELRNRETDIRNLQEKLNQTKKSCEEMREVAEVTDKQLLEISNQYEKFKTETNSVISEMKATETELRNTITQLEIKVTTSKAAEAEVAAQREGELASLRSKVDLIQDELSHEKERNKSLETELKEARQQLRAETERLAEELKARSAAELEVTQLEGRLTEAECNLTEAQGRLDGWEEARMANAAALDGKVTAAIQRAEAAEARAAELTKANDLLQDQVINLTDRLNELPSIPAEEASEGGVAEVSEGQKETKALLEVYQFVRKEKAAAVNMAEALKTEKIHLEAEVEVLKIQLSETRKALEEERSKSDTPTMTAKKHSELLHQVEMVNELTESNRRLVEETESLRTKLVTVEAEARRLDEQVVSPAKLRVTEATGRLEALEIENECLKAESARWQARCNDLIEKCNKTNPEDLKRLNQEKEELTKQLTTEKELFKSLRTRLESQLAVLNKERIQTKTEMERLESSLNESRINLEAKEKEARETSDKLTKAEQRADQLDAQCEEVKAKELQFRQIAKKYKLQFMELSEKQQQPGPSDESRGTVDGKVKELTDQLAEVQGELDRIKKENDALQTSSVEKEDRAKTVLKNARSRVVQLMEEKNMLLKELNEFRARPKGDADARILALESRITRLEKEKADEQSEKERLGSEVETLTQKLNILQRQLDKHQGSKPTTSCVEKGTNEPPTANIKPMAAGTSSSTAKQHQHSATVTPWRETTPFASIRPMSQPTRTTVVVLPTSQTTSTSNQPQVVLGRQQSLQIEAVSPSSSHMDYMPVTSSHGSGGAARSHSSVTGEEDGGAPQAQNVALVLPQPTAQAQTDHQQQSEANENTAVVSGSNQEGSEPLSSVSQAPVVHMYRQVEEAGGSVASSQGDVATAAGTSASTGGGQPSSTSNVSTSQGGVKRPPSSPHPTDIDPSKMPQAKRSRVSSGSSASVNPTGSGCASAQEEIVLRSDTLDVEYQVPTSSQRDDSLVVSDDDDDIPDQGAIEDGGDFEEETEEEGRYGMETYNNEQELTSFDEADGADIDEGSNTDQDNNEVDIIEDSNEVPNQCESSGGGTTGGEPTSSGASFPRRTPAAPPISSLQLSRHHMLLQFEESGDDSIVPSTPTLYVAGSQREGFVDGGSPQVAAPRFTFATATAVASSAAADQSPSSGPPAIVPVQMGSGGIAQVASEGMDDTRMDLSQLDETRRVPSTPSAVSPQDGGSRSSSTSSGSGEVGQSVGPDAVAGPSDAPLPPHDSTTTSSVDAVSEGEKGPTGEEEGREAEASGLPLRGRNTARRTARSASRRPPHIIWTEPQPGPASTSAPTPPTQTITMLPVRGMRTRAASRGELGGRFTRGGGNTWTRRTRVTHYQQGGQQGPRF